MNPGEELAAAIARACGIPVETLTYLLFECEGRGPATIITRHVVVGAIVPGHVNEIEQRWVPDRS